MKVINLNSRFDLTKVQIEFAKSIMSAFSYNDFICRFFDFNFFMDKIPVFLINEATMEKLDDNHIEPRHNQDMESRPATEWLGMYMSKCNIIGVDYPVIALCPERIVRIVRDDKELCWLVVNVLIHEFSHAAMDKEDYGKRFDRFYDWVEEPMANLLTLCVVKWYSEYSERHQLNRSSDLTVNGRIYHAHDAHDFYDFVLNFVSSQPDNYRIAAYLHTGHMFDESECDKWARSKDKFCNNTWQKKLWLDYWNKVLSKECKYDNVIAYEIWNSFDGISYDKFKKILVCFQDTMKEASKGMFSEDKIKDKMKPFMNHLYGEFRIILDRADWKKSYIAWKYYNTLCNVRIEPVFDNTGNLSSFGFVDNSVEKNSMSYAIKDNDDALIRFLDKFTETAIRSAF